MITIRLLSTLGLAIVLLPARASGQSHWLSISADAVIGRGQRTQHTTAAWFRGSTTPYGRAALAILGPAFRGVRPLLQVDRSVAIESGEQVALCQPAPDGNCVRPFPRTAG